MSARSKGVSDCHAAESISGRMSVFVRVCTVERKRAGMAVKHVSKMAHQSKRKDCVSARVCADSLRPP